jgi:hypothetical protein
MEDLSVAGGERPAWSFARKVSFRCFFSYFLLYLFPFPLDVIPYVGLVGVPYGKMWNALVPWVGKRLFAVDITVLPNGSGDTTYNYVQLFCYLILAVLSTLVWSVLDRRRREYGRLADWFRVYLRFSLATVMLSYGAVKVIKSQFPTPTPDRLLQPFGDASPMGILWTFMGASVLYNVFSGACEMVGGLLLLTRRTTVLGALFSMCVLANVVLLNFSYDVPVKLYSCNLFVMGLLIAAPDARRLVRFFVLNRPVEPARLAPLFERAWLRRTGLVLRTVFLLGFAAFSLYQAQEGRKAFGELAPKTSLYGVWTVDEIEVDGQPRPPLVTDETRWRRLIFPYPGQMSIQLMNNSRQRYNLKLDEKKGLLQVANREDPNHPYTLTYTRPGPGLLAVEGTLGKEKIRARLHHAEVGNFLLLSRGFHWINEYPFNR